MCIHAWGACSSMPYTYVRPLDREAREDDARALPAREVLHLELVRKRRKPLGAQLGAHLMVRR